jgi:hypothetical protein
MESKTHDKGHKDSRKEERCLTTEITEATEREREKRARENNEVKHIGNPVKSLPPPPLHHSHVLIFLSVISGGVLR